MRLIVFNLQDYRKARQLRARGVFAAKQAVALALLAGVVGVVSADLADREQAKAQHLADIEAVNQDLAQRVDRANRSSKELADLKAKVAMLEAVEQQAVWSSEVLSLLEASKPSAVDLQQVTVKDGAVQLKGVTTHMPALSAWVKRLEQQAPRFNQVELKSVSALPSASGQAALHGHRYEVTLRAPAAMPLKTQNPEVVHAGLR